MRSASGPRRMSLLTLALQLSFVNAPPLVDRGDLIDGLVVTDVGDAGETKGVARFVALRFLNAIEGNLEDDRWLDGVDGPVARSRRCLKVLGQPVDLSVGQARVGFPDVDQLIVAANGEGDIREHRAAFAVAVLRRGDDTVERRQRLLVLQPRLAAPARRVYRIGRLDHQPFVGAGPRSIEKRVDVRAVTRLGLNRETDGR